MYSRGDNALEKCGSWIERHARLSRPCHRSDCSCTTGYRGRPKDLLVKLEIGNEAEAKVHTHTHPAKLMLALFARHVARNM